MKKNTEIFHTAAYIRLSREDGDKAESNSIGNQKKLIFDFLAGKEEFILYDVYIERFTSYLRQRHIYPKTPLPPPKPDFAVLSVKGSPIAVNLPISLPPSSSIYFLS